MISVRYLYHSGFAVTTDHELLIFDYFRDTPKGGSAADGVVDRAMLADRRVTVFSSHAHPDHFNPVIFSWEQPSADIRYVLSSDIPARAGAVMIGPGEERELTGMRVRTLRSNDEGVAFLMKVDGVTLYHAGDLNWWRWDGEPEDYNRDLKQRYLHEMDRLRGESIDLAMLPVDPRLDGHYTLGIDHFMRTVGSRWVLPMHFGDDTPVCQKLMHDPVTAPYRDKIRAITRRGEVFAFPET